MPDRFKNTNPEPVPAGGKLDIHFENSSLANTTVTVNVSNGEGTTTTVQIPLDASGKGSTSWTVPATGWDLVLLSHATSEDHTVAVTHDPPPPIESLAGPMNELNSATSDEMASNAAGKVFLVAKQALQALEKASRRSGRSGAQAKLYLKKLRGKD